MLSTSMEESPLCYAGESPGQSRMPSFETKNSPCQPFAHEIEWGSAVTSEKGKKESCDENLWTVPGKIGIHEAQHLYGGETGSPGCPGTAPPDEQYQINL